MLSFIFIAIIWILLLINVDVSIKCPGITKPASERTLVKSALLGIIDSIFFQEGSLVKKDAIILTLKDYSTRNKLMLNNFELQQDREFIHDLQALTTDKIDNDLISGLKSALYKEQAMRFIHRMEEQKASLKKADKETTLNSFLAKEKVISPKEFFDIQIQQQKITAGYKSFQKDQLSEWQQDLARYNSTLSVHEEQQAQLAIDQSYAEVKAPVTGTVLGINIHYPGNLLQANETICTISPEGEIIGECYALSKDIGLIQINQQVRFQVDAFNHNYFGSLDGKVIAIDNDYSIMDNRPVFKIRCSFCNKQFHIKKFSVQLKKGLSFEARFIIGRRRLWQLLFDRMDDWLNPAAPASN